MRYLDLADELIEKNLLIMIGDSSIHFLDSIILSFCFKKGSIKRVIYLDIYDVYTHSFLMYGEDTVIKFFSYAKREKKSDAQKCTQKCINHILSLKMQCKKMLSIGYDIPIQDAHIITTKDITERFNITKQYPFLNECDKKYKFDAFEMKARIYSCIQNTMFSVQRNDNNISSIINMLEHKTMSLHLVLNVFFHHFASNNLYTSFFAMRMYLHYVLEQMTTFYQKKRTYLFRVQSNFATKLWNEENILKTFKVLNAMDKYLQS